MFQSLLQIYYSPSFSKKSSCIKRVSRKWRSLRIHPFPRVHQPVCFVHDLRDTLAQDGLDMEEVIRQGQFRMLSRIPADQARPELRVPSQGPPQIHSYRDEYRTAFEEQIAESVFFTRARRA